MRRGLAVLAILLSILVRAAGQAPSVLQIKVVLLNAERRATPVARHALLISDNPATAPPRRIVTGADGTADVRLLPGNYTVESDVPIVFEGRAHIWTQTLDIVAGRDAVLELTADNVEVVPLSSATTTSAAPLEAETVSLSSQWQDSVVALWTPTTHASGFVIDANGLIATNQRVIGGATSVEVQLTPTVKVAATIVAADPVRDVAIIRIDPITIASLRPVPLGCVEQAKPPVSGQEIVAIEAPLRQQKGTTSGTVSRVEARAILSDLYLATGGAGGPVFTAGGGMVGLTSFTDESDGRRRGNARVVRIGDVCEVVASALQKMKDVPPPGGTLLPVEPAQAIPVDALKNAAGRRGGSVSPYQISSSAFDIAFITPVMTYGAQHQSTQMNRGEPGRGERSVEVEAPRVHPLMDFSNWSEYVADYPPVLLVRVTPKLVEGFWTKFARGAAYTQGVALPPIKRFKAGFLRMRAYCGDKEITPIHPFKLEQRVSETEAVYEGLYAYDPGVLGPACGAVKLVLYSEKEPEKGDTQVVDANVVQQIWQDFAPLRDVR